MASMSISGVVSGMDWESMIDEIITAAAKPAQVQVSKKTNLQNKKSLFEEMKVMVQSIQTSMTSLKLPSTYKAKAVDIERIDGSGSYKGVLTATVNADAEVNVYDIVVKQLASAQTNRSKQITASSIASTLTNAGVTNTSSTMYINAGGQKIGIEVKSTDSLESIKSRINNTVKTLSSPLAITASVVDNRLVIKSDNTGLGITTTEETFNYNPNGINTLQKISADKNGTLKLTSGGTTYTEGTDYTIVNGNQIRWKQYDTANQVSVGDSVNAKYTMAAGDIYTVSGTYGTSEAKISGFDLIDKGTLASRVKITDTTGRTYTYGDDFKIEGKKVVWLENDTEYGEPSSYTVSLEKTTTTSSQISAAKSGTSTDDAISDSDFAQIEAVYNEKYGTSAIPTVTLTGSDGVLRTYLDPNDSSLFDMTSGGNTYKYGRDYVIRVNDNGQGYSFSWLVTDDNNGDGDIDIKDANIEVATYTAHKGISTSGWLAAPDADENYSFSFSNESTNNYSASMKSSDTDKNLSSVLGVTLDASDYDNIVVKNGSKTYTLGTDFTIDDSGNISWIDNTPLKPSSTDTFTVKYYESSTGYSMEWNDITLSDNFSITDMGMTITDDSVVTIENDDGTIYTQGKDFTINSDGRFSWLADEITSHPTGEYTLTYESFNALEAEVVYASGATTTTISDFSGLELSYSDILSDLSLTSSSTNIDEEFAKVFTLNNGSANLTYGTDYKITADSSGNPQISWIGANKPAAGTVLTLTYTGRGEGGGEVLTIDDAVTRSAVDSVNADTSNIQRPLYSNFSDAEIRITDAKGTETYILGSDFTLGQDANGNAVINWKTDNLGEVDYATYFDGATTSILDANGNETTLLDDYGNEITSAYTISANGSGDAEFAFNDGSVLAEGEYTIKTVKDGKTVMYNLSSDGSNMEITKRQLWYSKDNSSADSYKLYVTKGGVTSTYTGTRSAGSYNLHLSASAVPPTASALQSGTTTITQGTKTFYEGEDYTITADSDGYAQINWISDADGGTEWYYPNSGTTYTINHTDDNGNTKSYTAYRSSRSVLNMADVGMTKAEGSLSVQYGDDPLYYKLDIVDDDGNTGNDVLKATHSFTVDKGTKWSEANGTDNIYTFNWQVPSSTSRSNLPAYGDEVTAEYEHEANTFTLSDDGSGVIDALGLNDEDNITEAHNAILTVDGEEVQRDRNTISEAEGNELIKGMTINLKGLGEVSLDVYHDAEKAVEAINTFKDGYNDLMTWMNTRMTESQVDEDTAATVDSDDFRMRWGLLHGNSLLRNTKSQMRNLTSQSFTFSFTQRASASEIYGTMENNGLRNASTLRLRIGSIYSDVTIQPYQTLQDVVDMLNDSNNPEMRNMFYGEDGKLLDQPKIKASVTNDRLTITSTGNDAITISGTNAMNALKLNYTYKGLFQIGLATTSTDYGKSGELEFDESTFMEALEDNAGEVQELMLMFANDMDSWLKSMLTTSASGETSGTLTRQIEDIDTQIKSIDEYLEKYQDRLDRQEESLRTKFAAAEQNISKLSQQANSIAAILNQLNGYSSSSSSSSS